jgi:hypothetical protein
MLTGPVTQRTLPRIGRWGVRIPPGELKGLVTGLDWPVCRRVDRMCYNLPRAGQHLPRREARVAGPFCAARGHPAQNAAGLDL